MCFFLTLFRVVFSFNFSSVCFFPSVFSPGRCCKVSIVRAVPRIAFWFCLFFEKFSTLNSRFIVSFHFIQCVCVRVCACIPLSNNNVAVGFIWSRGRLLPSMVPLLLVLLLFLYLNGWTDKRRERIARPLTTATAATTTNQRTKRNK